MWIVRMLKAIFGRDKIVTGKSTPPMPWFSIQEPIVKRTSNEGININPLIEPGRNPLPARPPKAPPPAPSQCGQCVKCKHVIISNDESYPSGGFIICLKTGK